MKTTLTMLVILATQSALTQPSDAINHSLTAPNSVYVEIGGNAASLLSPNYDRLFSETFAGGISYSSFEFGKLNLVIVSAMAHYLLPLNTGSDKFEIGVGPLFVFTNRLAGSFSVAHVITSSGVKLSGVIGVRHQSRDGGLLFRLGFTPLLADEGATAGIAASLGYTFYSCRLTSR